MKLLLLGGTRFLGRHIAEQALAAGHELTLLHRGRSNAALFPEARHLIADRDGDLAVLQGSERWDVAIDTSAYVPRQVRAVAVQLSARVDRCQFISSISVYADLAAPGATEEAPTLTLADPNTEQVTGETYGGLKRLCELAAIEGFGAERTLIARPGLIVGPHDPTGRFTWWVQRLLRGGDVLVPGPQAAAVQFIDARDAAAWLLRQAEARTTGVFNLTGPDAPLTMGGFFERARQQLNASARLCWVDGDWLLAQGVQPWTELPLWVPPAMAGLHAVDIARALTAGFVSREVEQTLRDTAAWLAGETAALAAPAEGVVVRQEVGLDAEREHGLLRCWKARG